jgi:hypothetical protein
MFWYSVKFNFRVALCEWNDVNILKVGISKLNITHVPCSRLSKYTLLLCQLLHVTFYARTVSSTCFGCYFQPSSGMIFIYFTNTLCTTYWILFVTVFYCIVTRTAHLCVNDYEDSECVTCHSCCMDCGMLVPWGWLEVTAETCRRNSASIKSYMQ